jgi:GNAT superfamily N-acetyltransferase
VRRITVQELRPLVKEFHYLGLKPFRASFCFGLFVNNALLGGIAFHGLSAPETAVGALGLHRTDQSGLWEIGRLVLRPEANGQNLGSFLIAKSIKLLRQQAHVRAIITYAEAPRHNGGVYRAANFNYCGLTSAKNDFYVNGVKKERGATRGVVGGAWKPRPRKHRFIMLFDNALLLKWKAQ